MIRLQLERDFDNRMKIAKERFDQKIMIFKKANEMSGGNQIEGKFISSHNIDLNDPNSSIEYAKATVMVTQAYNKNRELELEIDSLRTIIHSKDEEIAIGRQDIELKGKE